MDTVDQPNSICHIQSIHMYPLQPGEPQKPPPFNLLSGEMILNMGSSVDGLIVLTNYRIYLQNGENQYHIPLGLIETLEIRELFYLQLFCKDARTYRCTFENNESALEWYERVSKASEPPRQIEQLFAFYYCVWAKEKGGNEVAMKIEKQKRYTFDKNMFENEGTQVKKANLFKDLGVFDTELGFTHYIDYVVAKAFQMLGFTLRQCWDFDNTATWKTIYYTLVKRHLEYCSVVWSPLYKMARMQFQGDSWRITKANDNYKLCPTYPPYLLVPSCINDEMLESVAKFRSSRRIPAAVWRHPRNGAIIARSSQPEVGWLGWRSSDDEELLKAISEACNFDRNLRTNSSSDKDSVLSHSPGSLHSDESLQITGEVVQQEEKLLIMDARSYTTAVANRARGGGCECPEYYPNCEIQFMNLANIHSIRKSFHALRQLCMSSAEQPNWFSLLENTRWLLHMSGLMKAAVTLATAVERDGRPVLVHCSDGWDRTPQIVALAELLLDPYYRTVDGFRILIEREWLAFGHKFADRCGHSGGSADLNERCPVFLQWLDCVHQLITQFPVSFEFSHNYLVKLAQHTYSNLFGTFLCNTTKQRNKVVLGRTFSVWEFLGSSSFKNYLYTSVHSSVSAGRVLWPKTNVRDLRLWSEVYLGSMESNFSHEEGPGNACPGPPEVNGHLNMAKTRSYGDLISADACPTIYSGRRNSDPSVNRELKLVSHENPISAIHGANHRTNNFPPENHDAAPDFLPSDLEDNPTDCNQDCIYNTHSQPTPNLTDDQIDGLDIASEEVQSHPEDIKPTDDDTGRVEGPLCAAVNGKPDLVNGSKSMYGDDMVDDKGTLACLKSSKSENDLNIDGFLENNNNSFSSHSGSSSEIGSCNGKSFESNGVCRGGEQVGKMLDLEKSVETSTETLVSEQLVSGSSPKEYNGFEKISNPIDNIDGAKSCKVCSQSIKSVNGNNRYPSRISPSPHSWEGAYLHNINIYRYKGRPHHCQLGEDGLMPLRSPIQERLDEILEEQKRKVELLEKELHASRQILIKQACHKCQTGDCERQDDSSSIVESLNSASEGQASAGESLRSDMSWVAVEEGVVAECQGTLWVPDHAASRCTGCGTEFWLGRRRHHCRKCGKIFCADCSEHATPVPAEQLYNPVRVCSSCYSELRLTDRPPTLNNASESPPDRCKRETPTAQGAQRLHHTQIAASSN